MQKKQWTKTIESLYIQNASNFSAPSISYRYQNKTGQLNRKKGGLQIQIEIERDEERERDRQKLK